MRHLFLLGALVVTFGVASPVRAYTIGTGFTDPCHEEITANAYENFLLQVPIEAGAIPPDQQWRRVGSFLVEEAGVADVELSESHFFLLTSLLVGVRAPDTEGHSVLDLDSARALHTDPDPAGQYAHALRSIDDDNEMGNRVAIAGTRAAIAREINIAAGYGLLPPREQVIEASIYFDFYGVVELRVWAVAYHLGRALHALQDSFSHTIRDAADGYRTVLTVLNYAEAVAGTLVESRDGLPHANSFDSCDGRTDPVIAAATEATRDLFAASRELLRGRDRDALQGVLDGWLRYRSGCSVEDGFCGNDAQLALLRDEPTGPFLCAVGWNGGAMGEVVLRTFLVVCAVLWWRRRR